MNQKIKIDPYGFREYDARWLYEKDISREGITNLGKGLGTQIKKHTKKENPRVIVGHDYRSYSEEIKSALTNLVSNALRYTPSTGAVKVFCSLKNDHFEFSVKDTGVGISPEHLPRLTERFYRVDRSRSRDTGGTGLGLAIVKHVIQRHGGHLRIESKLNLGSCFTLEFPNSRFRRKSI